MTKTQTRGICQCCGNEQAVMKSGKMSKHGYTVEHGWFNGVCSGQRYQPMQKDITKALEIVDDVREECAELRQHAQEGKEGKRHPKMVETGYFVKNEQGKTVEQVVAWEDASEYQQEKAVKAMIWKMERRAKMGEEFAAQLEQRARATFGTELKVVEVAPPAKWISPGERRKGQNGGVLVAMYQDGARVYFKMESGRQSWYGSAAWRKLELIEE